VLDFATVILTRSTKEYTSPGKSNKFLYPLRPNKNIKTSYLIEKDAVYTYHFLSFIATGKENIYLVTIAEPDVLEGGEKSRLAYPNFLRMQNKLSISLK